MNTTLENQPTSHSPADHSRAIAKTRLVLNMIWADNAALRAGMLGADDDTSPDTKLREIVRGLGQVADQLRDPHNVNLRLRWLVAYCEGWLKSLGESDVEGVIAIERGRQRELLLSGKIRFDCASAIVTPLRKLRVLTEEVGEVAEEIDKCERTQRVRKFLAEEIAQVAAVSVAWLESL